MWIHFRVNFPSMPPANRSPQSPYWNILQGYPIAVYFGLRTVSSEMDPLAYKQNRPTSATLPLLSHWEASKGDKTLSWSASAHCLSLWVNFWASVRLPCLTHFVTLEPAIQAKKIASTVLPFR